MSKSLTTGTPMSGVRQPKQSQVKGCKDNINVTSLQARVTDIVPVADDNSWNGTEVGCCPTFAQADYSTVVQQFAMATLTLCRLLNYALQR